MEEESDYVTDKYAFYRSGAAVCIGTVELLYVRPMQGIGILCVLLLSEGDCDRPIRGWLWTLMGMYFTHVVLVVLAECVPVCRSYTLRKVIGESYLPVNSIAEGTILLWVLLGNVWFYDCASTCRDGIFHSEFEEGFIVTLVVLVTYYSILALLGLSLLVVAALICVGNAVANRAKYATMS